MDRLPHSSRPPVADAAVAAGVVVFVALAAIAMPTTYLLDSSELVATTWDLGVSHPPGHPAYHQWTRLWMGLPFGTIAFRAHLAGAALVALSAAMLVVASWRWGWAQSRAQLAGVALVAVATTTSWGIALQAVRAEVYPLQLAAVAVLTALVAGPPSEAPRTSTVGLAGVVLGVALLNHHYLAVLTVPALIVAAAVRARAPTRTLHAAAIAAGAAALALPGYAWLLVAGARDAQATWGWPATASDAWWFMSAQAFQGSVDVGGDAALLDRLAALLGLLSGTHGLAMLSAAGVGVALLAVRQPGALAVLATGIACNVVSVAGLDPDVANPDVSGYLMATLWWTGLLAAYPVTRVARRGEWSSRGRVRLGWALAIVVFAAATAVRDTRPFATGRSWDSEVLRDIEIDALPARAIWAPAYFETVFNAWYAQRVEDRRPDVVLVPRPLLTHASIAARAPGRLRGAELLLPEPGGHVNADTVGLRALYATAERVVSPTELRCARVDGPYLVHPRASAATTCAAAPPDDPRAALAAWQRVRSRLPAVLERQTARNLMWATWNAARAACATGRPGTCGVLTSAVLPLSPSYPMLLETLAEAQRLSGRATGASTPE